MSIMIRKCLENYFKKYPLLNQEKVAVAVSGGADSLALAYNLNECAKEHHLKLYALTVNHQLRPEAKAEADEVHRQMEKLGISHTTLVWQGVKPKTHLEEKAREKRYELMIKWCHQNGVKFLFLAHHQGDNAETFWARLARGSGLDGLAAMSDRVWRERVWLCRPFLTLPKAELIKDLKKRSIKWAEDSMNTDEKYERVLWRNRQKKLSEFDLSPESIGLSAMRMRRAKTALDFYAARFMESLVDIHPKGYATISVKALKMIPLEIQIRVLSQVLHLINPSKTPIPLNILEQYFENNPTGLTIGGCLIMQQKGILYIGKELRNKISDKEIIPFKIISCDRFLIYSNNKIKVSFGCKDEAVPSAIQKSIPKISGPKGMMISFLYGEEKELEKRIKLDYKDKKFVYVLFKKGEK